MRPGMYEALTFKLNSKRYHINISVTATEMVTLLVDDKGSILAKKAVKLHADELV